MDKTKKIFNTFQELVEGLSSRVDQVRSIQCTGASQALVQAIILRLLQQNIQAEVKGNLILVVPDQKKLQVWQDFFEWVDKCKMLSGGFVVTNLPAQFLWGHERTINQTPQRAQRMAALYQLASSQRPAVVLTTLAGLTQRTVAKDEFLDMTIQLHAGLTIELDDFILQLQDRGYREASAVEEHGQFAIRGGIVDVYPTSSQWPVRLEFFADALESLRSFDPINQRSLHDLDQIALPLAYEAICPLSARSAQTQALYDELLELDVDRRTREGMVTAFREGHFFQNFDMFLPVWRQEAMSGFDYVNDQDVYLFPDGIPACRQAFEAFLAKANRLYERDRSSYRPSLPPNRLLKTDDEITRIRAIQSIEFNNPIMTNWQEQVHVGWQAVEMSAGSTGESGSRFETTFEILQKYLEDDAEVVLLIGALEHRDRLQSLLEHRGIDVQFTEQSICSFLKQSAHHPRHGLCQMALGYLDQKLWLPDRRLLLIPEHAFFGKRQQVQAPAAASLKSFLNSFKDLKVGDLVVHLQHGIARYRGLQSLVVGQLNADYLVLEYAGGDKVYLPVDKLGLLQRYQTSDGKHPPLDRLKSQSWKRRKGKVKKAIKDMADQLIKMDAQRQLKQSYAFSALGDDYFRLESDFAFEETPDQRRAIQEVHADLSSTQAMDRLICGDVGFGKTEVALRAAYRVVLDHFQVMVLVPTTILSFQHYRTFHARLSPYGVQVEQLNRFVSKKEQTRICQDFAQGRIDILVGTHRLLSSDVMPRRLGLLVIDEEQRFGVSHKEKLKELRVGADVLTLTATPIPRTLHMAMLGLRDISLITTPPPDRRSVQTYISAFDAELIREALTVEMKRGGQVFFVHNRVEDIAEVAEFIKSLVPQVQVCFAHGQMPEATLEKVIIDFIQQRFQVLVCTTIIESGIDMPNVNTLFVNRADRFGLAQLYQLRGRVGRSNRQAYAYFLTEAGDQIAEDARKRLDILNTYQDLGSGFQIASHDLELRGAGNLLGGEQSGHIADIGLELYTELLEAAINEMHGGSGYQERPDPEIKLPISASIPASYIDEESQRLFFYKSLFSAKNQDVIDETTKEMIDRFGQLPLELQRLLSVAAIKLKLWEASSKSLSLLNEDVAEIQFSSLSESQIDMMTVLVKRQPEMYQLTPDYRLLIAVQDLGSSPSADGQLALLKTIDQRLEPLAHALTTDKSK